MSRKSKQAHSVWKEGNADGRATDSVVDVTIFERRFSYLSDVCGTTGYAELEEGYKDHQVQLLATHRTNPKHDTLCPRTLSKHSLISGWC